MMVCRLILFEVLRKGRGGKKRRKKTVSSPPVFPNSNPPFQKNTGGLVGTEFSAGTQKEKKGDFCRQIFAFNVN